LKAKLGRSHLGIWIYSATAWCTAGLTRSSEINISEHLISDNAVKEEDKDNDDDDDNENKSGGDGSGDGSGDGDDDDDDDDDNNGARFLIPMTPAVFLAGTVLRLTGWRIVRSIQSKINKYSASLLTTLLIYILPNRLLKFLMYTHPIIHSPFTMMLIN